MSKDGQGSKWRSRNIAENFNLLSTAHERYKRQTDSDRRTGGQQVPTTHSEREREFTFTKKTAQKRKLAKMGTKTVELANLNIF